MKVTNTSYFRFRNHNHQSINEKSNNIDLLIVDRSLRIRFHRREDHSFIYHFLGLIFPSNVLHLFAAPKSTFHISVANTRVSTKSTCSHSYEIFSLNFPPCLHSFHPLFANFLHFVLSYLYTRLRVTIPTYHALMLMHTGIYVLNGVGS